MRRLLPCCLTVLLLASATGRAPAAEHTSDSLATVKANVAAKKSVLVDVREKGEWDRGVPLACQCFRR
ncbi:MAG: hypothetical protein WD069_09600 [Planctomycetales bacterium]